MKRTLGLVLSLIMVLGIFVSVPITANAASVSDLTFTLNDDGKSYCVSACNTSANGSLTIPSTYNGKPVTSIGKKAFYYLESLTKVIIPTSITSIGDYAFEGCTNLTSITIPDSVTSMGIRPFNNTGYYNNWDNWHDVRFDDMVVDALYIGNHLVCTERYVSGSYTIKSGTKTIAGGTFEDCESLTSVTIPNSVISIGDLAFCGCESLDSITIPDSVTSMGFGAFYNTAYYNNSSNWQNGVLYIGNHLITAKWSLSGNYAIKDGTKTIARLAFQECPSLVSITIPDSVVNIGEEVFFLCDRLASISVGSANKNYSSVDGVLFNKTKTELICYPAGKTSKSYTIPSSVTSVGNYAFEYCTSLTSITIPNGVTSIGDFAFEYCKSLTTITIPDSVISIGDSAFVTCTSLTTITIPDGVTSIGDGTFASCTSLTSITIPNSVTSIGNSAFNGCESLTSITIPGSVTSIGNYVFRYCTSLTSITIPNSVTSIGNSAFFNCWRLTSVVIPNSVTSIGYEAFDGCTNLKTTYYCGSETQWNNIYIGNWNKPLYNNIVFNYNPSKVATPKVTTTNEIGGVNVTWNNVAGATKYNVYRRQGGYSTWTLVGSTTSNTLLDKNVKSGIYYVYSVRAYNSAGQYSDFVTANTQTRKFMATPKLTTIYNHVNGLAIKWNAVDGITKGYRVYRRGAGSTYWTYLGTTKNLYFIDSQVKGKSGEYFRYTVIADGDYHSKFDTTGLYLRRLANSTLTSATSSSAGITVKWGAVNGTTGYYVYRKTANSSWVRIGTVGGTNNTTFLDKTAKKGTTYTYTVRAVYGATTSSYNSGISCYDKY